LPAASREPADNVARASGKAGNGPMRELMVEAGDLQFQVQADEAEWRRRVADILKGADFEKRLVSRSLDGIAIGPIYTAAAGSPVAGGQRPWHILQRLDIPDATTASAQALADLEGGADGLVLSVMTAHAARGHGLDLDTLDDLDAALAGVRLDIIDLRVDPSPAGRVMAAMLAALVERRRLDPAALRLAFGVDPIGLFAGSGVLARPWETVAGRFRDLVGVMIGKGFRGPFATADGRIWHDAGATEAQELAYVLATAVAYLRALEQNGLPLETAREAVDATLVADTDQFMSIAKFRAFRRLWAEIEAGCGLSPAAPVALHAETSWRGLTRHDASVNLLRHASAVFAAGIGGADSITVTPHSAAQGLPDAFARRLARNAQIILIEEAHLAKVGDPAAGSGAFEALTDSLAAAAWTLFQEAEAAGGMVASLAAGIPQRRIAEARARRSTLVRTRRLPLIGASEFPILDEAAPAVMQSAKPRALPPMAARPGARLDFAAIVDAFCKGMSKREVGPNEGQAATCEMLVPTRLSEPFEMFRDRAETWASSHGRRPEVALVGLGSLADHSPRLNFAGNLFAVGGFSAAAHTLPLAHEADTATRAAELAAAAGNAALICLCGSDEAYAASAAPVARALAGAGAKAIWLAGKPGPDESRQREAGISGYVFAGCDAVAILSEAFGLLGG
jgi:methylmalonyl-CoA mutase